MKTVLIMIPKAKQCKPNIFSKVKGRKAFQNSPKDPYNKHW